MLEKILMEICQVMGECLDGDQMEKLKNTLFISFRGKTISEDKCEIIQAETDEDMYLMKIFKASKLVSGRADGTLKQYIAELRCCRAAIGKRFKDITTMDLRWYFGMLKEQRGNKMTTIQNKMHYLNSFYQFLLNEGIIASNPLSRIESPKIGKEVKKPFSQEEMEAIRKACTHVRDRALVEFLYSTGLRVGEAELLNVGDIDMEKREFVVRGKGNKERIVYFSPSSRFHLKCYLDWRIEKEALSDNELVERPLFIQTKKHYGRISRKGIESICRRIGKKCGVKNVHPHRFRRTFATNMAARDMKLQEISKLMGHCKLETTMIYCDIAQDNVKNSYQKFCA